MIEKIKYVLLDFSDGFKNNFMVLFKKTAVFLIVGLVLLPFSGVAEFFTLVSGLCLVVFGFLWGRNLISGIASFGNSISNFFFKIFWIIFTFAAALIFGFIYFIWCVIKIVIYYIKKNTGKN